MRIGVTGHRDLSPDTIELVGKAVGLFLDRHRWPELVVISCLAEGADQLVAGAVLERGGQLETIVPSLDYGNRMDDPVRLRYDALVARARRVTQLPYPESKPEAHLAASLLLVERSQVVVAVWDGAPPRAFAGTADVVNYARQEDVPVEVIWPQGSSRR